MHQTSAKDLVTEEPYELIAHVRVCGGSGRVTAGPTRKPTRTSDWFQGNIGAFLFTLMYRACPRG
jgi:hypothetical protein